MKDAVDGLHEILLTLGGNRATCVGVAIKAREVAARDLQADTMSGSKDLGGCTNGNVQFIDVVWLHQHRLRQRFSVAGTQDAIGDRLGAAIGVDIDEFGSEIGIPLRRAGEQHPLYRTCYFNWKFPWTGGVTQYI